MRVTRRRGGAALTRRRVRVPPAQLGEPATKLSRFAALLHASLGPTVEPRLAEAAAAALGHLVASGGALTADVVEREARPSGAPTLARAQP